MLLLNVMYWVFFHSLFIVITTTTTTSSSIIIDCQPFKNGVEQYLAAKDNYLECTCVDKNQY